MQDNLFKTGAVMDMVSNAKAIEADTKSIEDAAIKNYTNKSLMPRKNHTIVREYEKIGRNEKCPCGSGKKYKHCCLESGKYEKHHELTALEMAKVKQNQINFADIRKNAADEVAKQKASDGIKKRTRTKKTTKNIEK